MDFCSNTSFLLPSNIMFLALLVVWFQKISIPSPPRVIGNFEEPEISQANIVKGMYDTKL